MDDGDTTTSPPTLSAHDDETVDRCSDENRPAALLKLGLRRLAAYSAAALSCAGNDSRFFAPLAAAAAPADPPPPPRSRSGVAGRCRGALCDRTRAFADSVAAM